MNKIEAEEIIRNCESAQDIPIDQIRNVGYADGYLKCLEQMQPVVESLEKLYSVIDHKRPAWTTEEMRWIQEAKESLDHYKKNVLGEK